MIGDSGFLFQHTNYHSLHLKLVREVTIIIIDLSKDRFHKKTSASGLVVKSNVAIVGPPVRFRACADFIFCSLLKLWMIHQLIQGKVQLPFPSMKKTIGSSVKPRGNANSSGVSYCFPLVIRLARQLVKMKPSHEHLYTISSPDRQ